MILEIVVYNIESAQRAQEGGADRIELCDNPAEGGTTPSYGTIELVRQHVLVDVFVMIRPRGGDFCYSVEEYHSMKRDIEMCKRLSVDGVVFGILKPDGTLDKDRCRKLVEYARPLQVTCHRAFDMTNDPLQALEDCIEAGFDRILTSGQQDRAIAGVDLIARLIEKAQNRIVIMPGSGVNEETVTEIVAKTGAKEIHFSAVHYRDGAMKFTGNGAIQMGYMKDHEFKRRTVNPVLIKHVRERAEAAYKNHKPGQG